MTLGFGDVLWTHLPNDYQNNMVIPSLTKVNVVVATMFFFLQSFLKNSIGNAIMPQTNMTLSW